VKRLLIALAALILLRADMYPDGSNAKQPDASINLGAGSVIVRGPGIDPTGATDSTAAIQALIDTVPNGGTVRIEVPGTYLLTTGLLLPSRARLACGSGVTLKAGAAWVTPPGPSVANIPQYSVVANKNFAAAVRTDHDIQVDGCTFDTSAKANVNAIDFRQATTIRILYNRQVQGSKGNFTKMQATDDQLIAYNHAYVPESCLGTYEAPKNVNYLYNTCISETDAGQDSPILITGTDQAETAATQASGGRIEGNVLYPGANGVGIWLNGLGPAASGASNITVTGNTIYAQSKAGCVKVSSSSNNNVVRDNTCFSPNQIPFVDATEAGGGVPSNTLYQGNFVLGAVNLVGGSGQGSAPYSGVGTGTRFLDNYADGVYNYVVDAQGSTDAVIGENRAGTAPLVSQVRMGTGTLWRAHQRKLTWVPTLQFDSVSTGITYNNQEGYYWREGPQVCAYFYIGLSNKGAAAGNATIAGLPYLSATGPQAYPVEITQQQNFATITARSFGRFITGQATILLVDGIVGTPALTNAHFANSTILVGGGCYMTDS